MSFARRLTMVLVGGLFFLLALALSINSLSYLNFRPQYGFLKLKQSAIETGWYLPAYYSHVIVAAIILMAGFAQFSPKIGMRYTRMHRLLGKVYVFGILCFAAPGGMIMSMFINRGPWVLWSFILQCTAWFWCTGMAYRLIRKGDTHNHRLWIIRSFALTLAAITLRLYVFSSSWSVNLAQPEAYALIAWLSWVPNLLVAELYLYFTPALPQVMPMRSRD